MFIGTLAEMMVVADPALYCPFVSYETGKAVLYVRLQKALYGYLKSALLFYDKLVVYLEAYGFGSIHMTRVWLTRYQAGNI